MENKKPLSEFQLALQSFGKNRWAVFCLWLLMALYALAIGADFLSPYSYNNEERNYSYCPPAKIRIYDQGKLSRPFVYKESFTFNEYHQRIYVEDKSQKFPIKFFARGDEHKLLGVFTTERHLFLVDEPARIFVLGADSRGRDLFSRILYGSRVSLSIGVVGVLISFVIGLLVGGISGFYGGRIDNILMRLCEIVMMVPGFYLLLALRAAVPDTFNSLQIYCAIVVILSFIGWAGLARIIRGMCLSLKERDYILAAKALGVTDIQIIVKHILPHTISYTIFAIVLSVPGYILGESALSLIGLGIQDPYASWGNLLSDAMSIVRIKFAPWILTPAIFIFLTILCFNVIGDTLRDCLDPMLKSRKA